jgi:type II secretory pathway pseudopilin PulG
MKNLNQRIETIGAIFKDIYRSRNYGYSLLELLVALGMSFVGFSGAFMLYRAGSNAMNMASTSSQMQGGFRKAFETISQDLQETTVNSVDTSVPNALSFASAWENGAFQTNADASPDWKYVVVYFLDSTKNMLCRYTLLKDDWSTPFDTSSAFNATNRVELVSDVTGVQFQLSGNVLTITLTIYPSNQSAPTPMTATLSTQVYLRNSN